MKPTSWNNLTIGERAKLLSKRFLSGKISMLELDLLSHCLYKETSEAIVELTKKRLADESEDWTPLDELITSYQDILTALAGMKDVIKSKAELN